MLKILVIEDEINIAKNIKQILDLSDFYTIIAQDGKEGIELAKEENPDLILCDVMMPILDGYQVLIELKKDDKIESTPFIFLTAKSDRPDFRKGMELGADDYLTKPFSPEELLNAVEIRLQKKAKIHEKNQQELNNLSLKIQKSLPHELYTPLNGMILSANLLKEYAESMTIEEIKEIAQTLLESSRRLHSIGEKFILYIYLELLLNNPDKLQDIRSHNHQCLTKTILTTFSKIQAQKLEREEDLVLELEEMTINMAENDFYKIVTELLDNAFKFSQPGDQIKVLTNISEDNLGNLFIINQGKGMSIEQLKQITNFLPFNQGLDNYSEGFGLGLVIVKKILEIYQGSMMIESFVNNETIVHIILPQG